MFWHSLWLNATRVLGVKRGYHVLTQKRAIRFPITAAFERECRVLKQRCTDLNASIEFGTYSIVFSSCLLTASSTSSSTIRIRLARSCCEPPINWVCSVSKWIVRLAYWSLRVEIFQPRRRLTRVCWASRELTARLISVVVLVLSYNTGLVGLLRDFIASYVGFKRGCVNLRRGRANLKRGRTVCLVEKRMVSFRITFSLRSLQWG